jgi:hypothetical protein
MKNLRDLRVSGHKDYVAVDIIDQRGRITQTPFYLSVGDITQVLYNDTEQHMMRLAEVQINEDFTALKCKDADYEWESNFEELADPNVIRFIN